MSVLGSLGAVGLAREFGKFGAAANSGVIGSLTSPLSRLTTYSANNEFPNAFPSADSLIELYYKGGCTLSELKGGLATNGIQLPTGNGSYASAAWWSAIIDRGRPLVPFDAQMRSFSLAGADEDVMDPQVKRYGFRVASNRALLMRDCHSLDVSLIKQLLLRGIITEDDAMRYFRHAGWRNDDLLKLLRQESSGVDPATALTLLNRGLLTPEQVDKYQKWAGYRDDEVRSLLNEMRWQWPALSQVMQYAQLGALNSEVVDTLKLDNEKPDTFYQFARAAGQHWSAGDTKPETWPVEDLTPADLAWRAHWRPNDVASAITMLHRLRTDPDDPTKSIVPGVLPYTQADFDRDLAANLIPPGRREQFKAITYSLPRFTIFRTAYNAGTITKDEAVERLQDVGFAVGTAKLVANTWEHERTQQQIDKLRPISLGQVKEAYRLGSLSRERAAVALYMLYLDDYVQLLRLLGMSPQEQAAEAFGNAFVLIALNSIDADIAGELAKQAIEIVRKGFLRLEITGDMALADLIQLGIDATRARQYVQLWTYEHAVMGVEATAAQLRDWYLNHLIDQPTYSARLALLGYGVGDIALILARANLDLSERAAKLQAQSIKAQQMEQKQLAAAAKAVQQQQKSIAKAMCSSGTRNQIAVWAVKGYMTYYEAYTRLQECGMHSDDAVNLLTDKQPKKGGLSREQVEERITGKSQAGGTAPTVPAK